MGFSFIKVMKFLFFFFGFFYLFSFILTKLKSSKTRFWTYQDLNTVQEKKEIEIVSFYHKTSNDGAIDFKLSIKSRAISALRFSTESLLISKLEKMYFFFYSNKIPYL